MFETSRKSGSGGLWYAPGSAFSFTLPDSEFDSNLFSFHLPEASNCGGVAVSGLEMAQNSQRLAWTSQDVDVKLKGIMTECYKICLNAGTKWSGEELQDGVLPSLLLGANVAGFIKVADAMKEHGDWW